MKNNRSKNIEQLLYPKSIALIGASSKSGKVGNIILQNMKEWKGSLFLVHPKESEIMGKRVYPDLSDLPDNIDLAIITLGAKDSVEIAEECAAKGFKVIIIVAGGFSEIGIDGELLEERLKKEVLSKGTRILGPNTLGVFVPGTGLDTIFVEHGDRMFSNPGDVAFLTQSGSVGVEALGSIGVIGWGLRAFVGIGNRIDIGEDEFIEYFAEDDRTRCLALYLETFADGNEFMDKCRKASRLKPIVLLKAGRTEIASHAVASHTGKMAGSGKVFEGACKQVGVHLAQNEEQLVDYSKILAKEPPALNPSTAIITAAGGYGIISLDLLSETRYLKLADLSEETVLKLKERVPPFASLENPIDLTASADNEMIAHSLECLEEDPNVGIVLAITFFSPPKIDSGLMDILAEHRRKTRKPLIVYTAYGPFTNEVAYKLYEKGVMAFTSLSRAIQAMDILVERGYFLKKGGSG